MFTLPANLGKWEFVRRPFGLAQAPAYFQRLVNEVLAPFDFAFGYLDDILIYSPDIKTHLKHLRLVFERLHKADLKLKLEKCSFLKEHIQYLGHIISGDGITPVPEKLDSIKTMPRPYNPKEIKQFLGLVGYYRKFIPHFADLARPLNVLTCKDTEFVWTGVCQRSFDLLKSKLTEKPILVYPDPNRPYILFTDASKYAWSCMLTQEYTHEVNGKKVTILHPITYQSGLFKGSQINWACLTKEAYAIYTSVKKLEHYLVDADITLCSDHLPLQKFLAKNTLNLKVNNWAVEIVPFRIQFEYKKGIKNTLANTMSRLVNIDPATKQEDEPPGCEFGYYLFDPLPPIEVNEVSWTALPKIMVCDPEGHELVLLNPSKEELKVQDLIDGLEGDHYEVVAELQALDPFCKHLINNLKKGHLNPNDVYYLEGDTLKRCLTEDGKNWGTIVLPKVLIEPMMFRAHNMLGHNGTTCTYSLLHQLYFWKGMKNPIAHFVRSCLTCQKKNQQVVHYAHSNFQVATFPMEFISMDLIGELYPPSKSRHKYALTVICMLMGYVFCVPLKSKSAPEAMQAYIDQVYAKFGGSYQVLSDNGTEFKNQVFEQVTKELGVKYKNTPLRTVQLQMVALKDSIISSKLASPNTSVPD